MTKKSDHNAELALFPVALIPKSRDTVAMYEFLTSRLDAPGYAFGLLALHARALMGDADLAALFRSPEALSDVAIAAERYAAADRAAASASAVAKYKRAIAEQLAAVDGHELQTDARRYLEVLVASDRERTAEQRRAEQDRITAEQAAAEKQAVEEAERKRLADEATRAREHAEGWLGVPPDAGGAARSAANSARQVFAKALAARIRHHKLTTVRLPDGLYDVTCILGGGEYGIGGGHSIEHMTALNDAIDRLESQA